MANDEQSVLPFHNEMEIAIKRILRCDNMPSIKTILPKLEIPWGEETLRRALKGERVPKDGYEVLDKLRERAFKEVGYLKSEVIRDRVASVIETSGDVSISSRAGLFPCDLEWNPLRNPFATILIRCVDETAGEHPDSLLSDLVWSMRTSRIHAATLILPSRTTAEFSQIAARWQVRVITYSEFLKDQFRLDRILSFFEEKRKDRSILSSDSLMILSATEVGKNKEPVPSAIRAVQDFLSSASKAAMVAVLGSYGSGKTSALLVVAHEELQKGIRNSDWWILPVWINAAGLVSLGSKKAILNAIAGELQASTVSWELLEPLLKEGRLWVFVDGLDESQKLRDTRVLRDTLVDLLRTCGEMARVAISARRELFESLSQEMELLGSVLPDESQTLILELNGPSPSQIESVIRARLDLSEVSQFQDIIEKHPAVRELLSRPVFLDMLLKMKPRLANIRTSAEIIKVCVEQWAVDEEVRAGLNPLRMEERLTTCELLASLRTQMSGTIVTGLSVSDLKGFMEFYPIPDRQHLNLDEFVKEARVAMFLLRNEGDRFEFSNSPIEEFFLASLLVRDLRNGKMSWVSSSTDLIGPASLVRDFIYELEPNAYELAQEILAKHRGYDDTDSESGLPTTHGPGPYRYFLQNLLKVIIQNPSQVKSSVDITGSYLVGINFSGLRDHKVLTKTTDLSDCNLEFVEPQDKIATLDIPGALITDEPKVWIDTIPRSHWRVEEYCKKHDLFAPSEFNLPQKQDEEFVLIPGGTYRIPVIDKSKLTGRTIDIKVASFLIQRYPVTRYQFHAFLEKNPSWHRMGLKGTRSDNVRYLEWYNPDKPDFRKDEWNCRATTQVSWYAAAAFAAAAKLRLPTEIEWLIAATLGQNLMYPFPWGDKPSYKGVAAAITRGVYKEEKEERLTPPQSVFDTPEGFAKWKSDLRIDIAHHMIGLTAEWVADQFNPKFPFDMGPEVTPVNIGFGWNSCNEQWEVSPSATKTFVMRGASHETWPTEASVHTRNSVGPQYVDWSGGFRCVRDIYVASIDRDKTKVAA